ncbi:MULTISPECIES: ribosomal-processing cysteine protease Prp [unclassified Bacillus (in: firmicutes)]|uniref:ribosomal-processing cysteine protease Prp n=1 Tax=unclassified Bacillus (in: firmicutes) TaxID=185979 RepID=UPI001BEC2D96|nr:MULTISPECIES: ribosomal-processing cysteine protease Prp [unclassified Bacillus (in: firmicutes)]MBT2618457.1 ribosomal-processing cysteine protease Prp [Bacillus sp. ISL-78]MBT2630678.1 ribosomal-processing cysteine protease Prp [Bacillus sp. ISL-101]MBT2718752.1 ribosomal-processing cysteine protease Prp [Bacillus sp. ISL-57]
MIYKYGDKYIAFTEEVIKFFDKYKQYNHTQYESGGILLGKVYNDIIIIDQISEPSIEDKSGRFYFVRNVKKAQKIVEEAWKESNCERIYLGEWHTHPEDIPTPSRDDKILLKNMLKHSRMEIDFLFMVIIGRISPYFAVIKKGLKEMIPIERIHSTDGLHIIIYKNQFKQIYGFQVSGYLNLAPKGFDIYNAVFSQIFIGTFNSIIALTNIQANILESGPAFIRFIIPDIENADEKVNTLLDAMEVQIAMVIGEMKSKGLDHRIHLEIKS